VYVTLMESDVVETSVRTEGDTGPGRTREKPKDLSACESGECGRGEGVVLQEPSRLSLDTHRREVTGAYGTLSTDIHRKPQLKSVQSYCIGNSLHQKIVLIPDPRVR
jgi:hypothetical protein